MANSSKNKGDAGEREARALLIRLIPDLMHDVAKPDRSRGAGRSDDEGDLRMLSDTALQVKVYKASNLGQAVREASVGAVRQANNGSYRYGVGLVPIPGARKDGSQVRWMVCASPGYASSESVPGAVVEFKMISKLVSWIAKDEAPHGFLAYPRHQRVGLLSAEKGESVLVGPIEAWVHRMREIRGIPDPGPEALAAEEEAVWDRIKSLSVGRV